jgi:transcriptional regulator with PAS, ATPase and Fis domain
MVTSISSTRRHSKRRSPVVETPIASIDGHESHGEPQSAVLRRIVSGSLLMQDALRRLKQAAQSNSTVLLTGESGTGKELAAEAIHWNSNRADERFVKVNMAAIPRSLFSSELFGHVEGGFTGAESYRMGRFELADGGTILLDEIAELKPQLQARLLRVLDDHVVTPVGSNHGRKLDIRVIAATNRNLEAFVRSGKFRKDLYYRLNVIRISIPPLRLRPEDILPLVKDFVAEFCRSYDKPMPSLDSELHDFLLAHPWPGNVRQLRNCIESMIIMANSEMLTMADLPTSVHHGIWPHFNLPPVKLRELRKAAILQSLDQCKGNRTQAAQQLGIPRRTLHRWLSSHQSAQSPAPKSRRKA